jgi:NAD(P)-dependent dehydrogenase (short-subunit alcohol dehydrogenase family)
MRADGISQGAVQGQVAVVTGAARGLGFAISARLVADGAGYDALFDRDAGALKAAEQRLEAPGRTTSCTVDVADEGAVRSSVDDLAATHGRVDILVNNAGIFPHAPFEDIDLDGWRLVMATNLDGLFICTRAVYPHMRERGYGRIVNISSATFFIGYPEMTPYIASKGGIVGFTRALASEAGPHGITVNCVTPGLIETEGAMEEDPTGELFEEIVGGQAVRRRGRAEDIAECVAYLVRPGAGFITGQTINVDGGHRYH